MNTFKRGILLLCLFCAHQLSSFVLRAQSCPTLFDPMDHSPPGDLPKSGTEPASPALAGGSFITEPPGKPRLYSYLVLTSQREEVQLKWPPVVVVVVVQLCGHVQLFETPWTTAHQASLALTIC